MRGIPRPPSAQSPAASHCGHFQKATAASPISPVRPSPMLCAAAPQSRQTTLPACAAKQVISSSWGAPLLGLPKPVADSHAKDAPRQIPSNYRTSPSVQTTHTIKRGRKSPFPLSGSCSRLPVGVEAEEHQYAAYHAPRLRPGISCTPDVRSSLRTCAFFRARVSKPFMNQPQLYQV
jgi:hypothetical protein